MAQLCSPFRGFCVPILAWHHLLKDTVFVALVVHLSILVTTATAAGLKMWVYAHDGFYCHFNYVPVQKLRDIQVLEQFANFRVCPKNKLKVLASGFHFFSSYISADWGYCLSGDIYRWGQYWGGFLRVTAGINTTVKRGYWPLALSSVKCSPAGLRTNDWYWPESHRSRNRLATTGC